MKILSVFMVLLLTLTAQAGLLGKIEGQNRSYLSASIMEYGPKYHVGIDVHLEDMAGRGYRSVFFHLPVDLYHTLFNGDEDVRGEYFGLMGIKILYSVAVAKDPGGRDITIEIHYLDSSERVKVASKTIVRTSLRGSKASVDFEAFKRKQLLGFGIGKLKSVAYTKVDEMTVERQGVWLYGESTSFPLGRIVTLEGLKRAVKDTRTNALLSACQEDCRR